MPRARIPDARDRLLAAGLQLFARLGTERVNSNAIAKRAGLGIGTFYAHFEDKYVLLRELQVRTLAGVQQQRREAVERAGTDPFEQVYQAAEAVVEFAADHPEAYRVTFGRERAGAAAHGPVVSESSRPIAQALRRLQADAEVEAGLDPDLAARAYLAMEVGSVLWWLEDQTRARKADLVETLARLHPAVSRAPDSRLD